MRGQKPNGTKPVPSILHFPGGSSASAGGQSAPPAISVARSGPPRGTIPSTQVNVPLPKTEMGQLNYRSHIRFMLASGKLNAYELDVFLTIMRQSAPSSKQRKVLWRALFGIDPRGCGKWGSPGSN